MSGSLSFYEVKIGQWVLDPLPRSIVSLEYHLFMSTNEKMSTF